MNRTVITALVLACTGLGTADAMYLGVGPMIGAPLGIGARLWTRPSFALDAGVGYSWWQDSSLQVQGDLIFGSHGMTRNPEENGALGFYMGLGAQAKLADESKNLKTRVGLRMPLGIEYIFPRYSLSLYAQAVPIFNLGTTDQYFSGDGVFGFRYYWAVGSNRL